MAKSKIYSRNYRVRKAYWTAFVVAMSYLKLYLLSRLLGKRYYENRITNLHLKNANRVKKAILKLEGLFIKIGQLLSILSNFLPESFQEPLHDLQDKIPARPYVESELRIKEELGDVPENIFAEFDKTPIASASIGQVYQAKLKSGEAVVVKVQHANIEDVADVDLQIMQRLVKLSSWFFKIKGIEFAYEQVKKMVQEELDFKQEALSMGQIAKNLEGESRVVVPKVVAAFSTERVLTTSFCEGIKINDVAQIDAWGIDRHDLGNRLVKAFCKMVFADGFYHADPHPGNILVQQDGTIVLLDFGAVGLLDSAMRKGFLHLIEAAAKNDSEKIILALKELGFISDDRASEKIAGKVIVAFRNFLQNEVEFDGLNFKDLKVNPFKTSLFGLTTEIGLSGILNTVQVPKDLVLLNRMLTLLLGICNTLDPQINPIAVLRPYFQSFILGEKDLLQFAKDLLKNAATTLIAIPGDLQQVLHKTKRGELEVQVAGANQRARLFYMLGQQFLFLLLFCFSLGFSFLFLKEETFFCYGIGATVFFGFCLLRALRKGKRALNQM